MAGKSLCSLHHCEGKASLVPAPSSQHALLQDQQPSQHALWWQLGPVVNTVPTEKSASTYPYIPGRASSLDLLPEHKWPFAASLLSPRHTSSASPVCHDGPALAQSTGIPLSSLHSLQGPKHPLSRRHRNNLVSPLEYFCFGKVANKPMANAHLHTKRKVFVGLYT